ncbi:MAG TPA: hypothetical protein VIV60_36525 [Polyangiaceae bacterium]
MSSDITELQRLALRAYERGRVKWATLGGFLLLIASVVGLISAGRAPVFFVIAGGLALMAGIYIWRGGDAGNALLPGLAAGLLPLVLSAVLLDCRAECSGICMRHCMLVCAVGATAAGLLAAFLTRHHPRRWKAWLFAVALVPASGLLGCPHVGYGQVCGLLVGLFVSRLFSAAVD